MILEIIMVLFFIMIGFIINLIDYDYNDRNRVNFKYKEFPTMRPIPIKTKNKGFFSAIWIWLMTKRTWELTKDFEFELKGKKYKIPKGFTFDGASVPKMLSMWLSPVGVLLMGGIIHDYMYTYAKLLKKDGTYKTVKQKESDEIFRDINIEINGFFVLNYLSYYALRLFGFIAWKKCRKKNP